MTLDGLYGAVEEQAALTVLSHAIKMGLMIDTAGRLRWRRQRTAHSASVIRQSRKTPSSPQNSESSSTKTKKEPNSRPAGDFHLNNQRRTRLYPPRLGRQPATPTNRPHRPLLRALPLPANADRRHRRRHGGSRPSRQSASPRPIQHRRRTSAPAPTRYTPSSRCNTNTRYGGAEAETELLPTLRELGIALVAWSPLGAGFLTGGVNLGEKRLPQQHPPFQRTKPRHQPEPLRPARRHRRTMRHHPGAIGVGMASAPRRRHLRHPRHPARPRT